MPGARDRSLNAFNQGNQFKVGDFVVSIGGFKQRGSVKALVVEVG